MKRVLITGMSGTGKSSLLDELAARGYRAVERLATRTANPYGKDPAEVAQVLRYRQTVEPLLRAAATLEVVTTVPVARVADIVLDHVLRPLPPRYRRVSWNGIRNGRGLLSRCWTRRSPGTA